MVSRVDKVLTGVALQPPRALSTNKCKDTDNSTASLAFTESTAHNSQGISFLRFGSVLSLLGALFLYEAGKPKTFSLLKDYSSKNSQIVTEPPKTHYTDDEFAIFANRLRDLRSFGEREAYLNKLLKELNPELLQSSSSPGEKTALTVFNEKHNLSLSCMGIKKYPYEFVFINDFRGKNTEPIRIGLTSYEITNIKKKEDVINLLDRKLTEQKEKLEQQYSIWARPYEFDFPKNNGACMIALALNNLSGMETDMAAALELYNKHYGMSVEAICVDDAQKEKLETILKEKGFENLPQYSSATKEQILARLESSLKKAIDKNKSSFMFHYGAHGSPDGRIWASDMALLPEEIAEVISKPYHGTPMCAQIEITIWAGSCYSGKQLEGMKKYFEERANLPVRNLRVITESNDTVAGASTTPDNASLISDLMTDNSGPLDYYVSWYNEYLKYLESKNIKVEKPIGTYLHKVRFADLMGRYDSSSMQDSQGFHYYNDPLRHRRNGQYFTSIKDIPDVEQKV